MDSAQAIDTQLLKLQEKVKLANLPPELLEKITSMLSLLHTSLKTGNGNFVNYEKIESYINWVSSLPFALETKDTLDINNAKQILDKNHYGLESVKNTILEYLSAIILSVQKGEVVRAPILCLIGLVGTGKTTLAYSVAEALGRRYERIPLGGMGDSLALRGQSRSLPDAEPGQIVKKLVHAKSKNPVILLDELDRVSTEARADIMGVLVELLDSEQNKGFTDHYIDYPFDLSNVLFIATANNTTNISTAVLDRMEIIQMPSYSDAEKVIIGKDYLLSKIITNNGLLENQIVIDEKLWPEIIRPLGYDSGIRSLEHTLQNIVRKVAYLIVLGKINNRAQVVIDQTNIKQFLNI
jgi:ATP-dependent Lon protease